MSVGSIEKRGENKYRLTVSGGFDCNGKRIRHRKLIEAKSEREAKKQLALFVSEIEKGEYADTKKMTFKKLSEKWHEDYAVYNLEAKTLRRYEELLEFNILPVIGHIKLEQIKPMRLLDLYTAMTKDGARRDGKTRGYSAKTIQHVHRLIRAIFEKAVQWQIIMVNPASKIQPPKVEKKEISFYDDKQIIELMNAIESEPIRYKTMVLTAIHTGMRRGEIIAIEWNDVDFDKKLISINKSAVYVSGKGRILKGTKTVRSQRIIAMTDILRNALLEYKKWQEQNKEIMGDKWIESDIIFTRDNGEPLHPDTITNWFVKFIKRKGLPHITFHGLRHTVASLMVSSGVDVETVSRILGHATSATTSNVYLHSAQAARFDAMNKLNERLKSTTED